MAILDLHCELADGRSSDSINSNFLGSVKRRRIHNSRSALGRWGRLAARPMCVRGMDNVVFGNQ